MPTRTITTRIALDGEADFKKQLGNVNRELRNLDSEMKLVTAQFQGQANSIEALTAKGDVLRKEYDQTAEKAKALEKAVEDAAEAFGESDARTDKYRQSLNRAKADLIELERELQDNARYLNEARESADKTAKSIDELGREVRDVDAGGGLDDLAGKLDDLKNFAVGGAVVGGITAVKDALFEVVEASEEYRKIMGTLEVSSQAAGYTAEETAETYNQLYAVLGDTQTAATAAANLQAVGLEQDKLTELTDMAIGAWAKYGDSIPIDGLSEAINETIKVGQVTGTFADVLNWAGENEDAFNEKLAATGDAAERADLIMQAMSKQGLADAAEAWRDINGDIVAANESQAAWDASMATLGETLAPARDALRTFGAEAIGFVTDRIKDLIGWFEKLGEEKAEAAKTPVNYAEVGFVSGRHQSGLSYVPYDNYLALLHKGETVLTANEAATMRQLLQNPARMSAPALDAGGLAQELSRAVQSAVGGSPAASGPIHFDLSVNMDGATLARKQYSFNQREAMLRGKSLVEVGS